MSYPNISTNADWIWTGSTNANTGLGITYSETPNIGWFEANVEEDFRIRCKNKNTGKTFKAVQVSSKTKENKRTAKWAGALVYEAGLRVPTLEGVAIAFVGDWVLKNKKGLVSIYTDEDFQREFRIKQ